MRQGVISKAWLGTGEEAATVGPVFALDPATDFVAPMIRNAAACCDMGMPLADMFRAYLGHRGLALRAAATCTSARWRTTCCSRSRPSA